MSENDKRFEGSIPEIYDNYLVPLIFEEFAHEMADHVAKAAPREVLETAAGSGVLTRVLAPVLSCETNYIITDLNADMLERAKRQQPLNENFGWQVEDAMDLPFETNRFDVVCCQFGVMFFPDKVAGFAEARRVLKPGGYFIFSVWDEIQHSVFADHVTRAVGYVFADDPPVFLARTPHGYFDLTRIVGHLKSAGFAQAEIRTLTLPSVAKSPRDVAIAYCQGTPLRNEIIERDPDGLERVTDHATQHLESVFGSGPISGKIRGYLITAEA
ncbi:Demethylmenaquinone methyltransferase [Roseovarius albus]|uniref:Demethylmenaquinone methyltransferase n=1 Tax=Roseovarius albus TaxID=1247867 RepID=A0A1X6YXK5_9RHOB|nr:class I SAM-dependent methyltransferase [Roseovarius albus]SLN34680.1 Demethylmenaquinone methyltransferase [Roseovarius albus]